MLHGSHRDQIWVSGAQCPRLVHIFGLLWRLWSYGTMAFYKCVIIIIIIIKTRVNSFWHRW